MSATVLSVEAAKQANITLIENGRGTQAVHDVVVALRAARHTNFTGPNVTTGSNPFEFGPVVTGASLGSEPTTPGVDSRASGPDL